MSDAITPEADASATADAAAATAVEEAPAASAEPTGPAESSAEGSADPSDAEGRENPRKVREGIVVSTSMEKTAVVESIDRVRHRRYAKTVQRNKKLFAHDENNDANVGDRVRIQETRPLSKKKRWRLVEIIERAR
jgi:small subunit ribosomal protein S17